MEQQSQEKNIGDRHEFQPDLINGIPLFLEEKEVLCGLRPTNQLGQQDGGNDVEVLNFLIDELSCFSDQDEENGPLSMSNQANEKYERENNDAHMQEVVVHIEKFPKFEPILQGNIVDPLSSLEESCNKVQISPIILKSEEDLEEDAFWDDLEGFVPPWMIKKHFLKRQSMINKRKMSKK